MKNKRFAHILSIMVLALIFAFTMAVSVMADDTDSENVSADNVAAEEIADEDAEEEIIEVDDTEEVDVDDAEDIDDADIDTDDSDDSDIEDTDNQEVADDEEIGEVVSVDPADFEDEDQGELGEASWAEPVEGGMMYYTQYPDGTVEASFEPDEEITEELGDVSLAEPADDGIWYYVDHQDGNIESWFEPYDFGSGVVGDASSYDPTTGKTTVYKVDGSVKIYTDDTDDEYSYQTAAAVYSDTFAPLPVLSEEKTETVETVVAPAVESEESAVLGDYEEPESEGIPFTAGIAFFTSTLVGLGVLWKLGILAL